ncbi:MAG TPA: hypothetical protein VHC47_00140 [Mucilaginibacter sp.]|nr:hypothetical protein [Mucilaginibacter sp.]
MDTIFLEGITKFVSPENQWSFPLKHIEHEVLVSRRSDPNPKSDTIRYLDSLTMMTLFNDGATKLEIQFSTKNGWLYTNEVYTKDQFLYLPDTVLKIGAIQYHDVLIVAPNETITDVKNGKTVPRSNAISKLYWSKSHGIIRYDKPDGEYWELLKRE